MMAIGSQAAMHSFLMALKVDHSINMKAVPGD